MIEAHKVRQLSVSDYYKTCDLMFLHHHFIAQTSAKTTTTLSTDWFPLALAGIAHIDSTLLYRAESHARLHTV